MAVYGRRVVREDVRGARGEVVRAAGEYLGLPWAAITRRSAARGVRFLTCSTQEVHAIATAVRPAGDGPIWQVHRAFETVVSDDLQDESRWPEFRRCLARQAHVRSVLAVPLDATDDSSEALVFFSDEPRRFDDECIYAARDFAAHAALWLAHARDRSQAMNLEVALQSSRDIGMAVGIIMERLRVTEYAAFALLDEASQVTHHKLRDIAYRVVTTGELPPRRCGVKEAM